MAVLTKDGEPVTAVEDGVYEVAGNGRYTIMWQPAESMAV
jgi:hypothetical protein